MTICGRCGNDVNLIILTKKFTGKRERMCATCWCGNVCKKCRVWEIWDMADALVAKIDKEKALRPEKGGEKK